MNSRRLIVVPHSQDRASYRGKRTDWKGALRQVVLQH